MDKKRLELLRRTIAKDGTEDEILIFADICDKLKLNPFVGEIYFIPYKNRKTGEKTVNYRVSRDGLVKIANSYEDYQGLI